MTDVWQDRLSEYLDGELAAVEREGLEQHLFACVECTEKLAELRQVVERARSLDDVSPERDLWPGILERIVAAGAPELVGERLQGESRSGHLASGSAVAGEIRPGAPRLGGFRKSVASPAREVGTGWRRTFSISVPQLAAAAVLVLLVGGGAVWLERQGAPGAAGGPPGTVVPPLAETTPGGAGQASGGLDATLAAEASLGGPRYDAAVAELQQALAEGRGRLAPSTLQVLEQNLKIIDGAIGDAQRALEADPGNVYLNGHLAATMRRKLDLLRRAGEIARAQT